MLFVCGIFPYGLTLTQRPHRTTNNMNVCVAISVNPSSFCQSFYFDFYSRWARELNSSASLENPALEIQSAAWILRIIAVENVMHQCDLITPQITDRRALCIIWNSICLCERVRFHDLHIAHTAHSTRSTRTLGQFWTHHYSFMFYMIAVNMWILFPFRFAMGGRLSPPNVAKRGNEAVGKSHGHHM